MASFGSFAFPLALLDSHLGLNLHATTLDEKLTIDRFDIEDGPPLQLGFLQEFPWEYFPHLRGFVKEILALIALLNFHCSS